MKSNVNIKNKKASFEYHLEDVFTCGIKLTGTEIKSVRNSKASINEAYCYTKNNEVWIKNMHIAEYEPGSYNNHAPKRERKLLLNRKEIDKIEKELKVKGTTLIALSLFINEKGLAKIKKLYDKRQDIKARDTKKELARIMKK